MRLMVRMAWVSWWSACVGGCLVILLERLGWFAFLPAIPMVVMMLVLWAQYLHEVELEQMGENHGT